MSSTPIVAKNARIFMNSLPVAFGKGFNTDQSNTADKDYSVDSRDPAMLEYGNNSHVCTLNTLYTTTPKMLKKMLDGTKFTMVVAPKGTSPLTPPYETWNECIITNVGVAYGETGCARKNVKIEARTVVPTDS